MARSVFALLAFLFLTAILRPANICAQTETPFKRKVVGVYISKKQFAFSDAYYKMFAHFTDQNDTLNLTEETLKLGMTIKLGEFLTQQIKASTGADSVYFVNTVPAAAKILVNAYSESLASFGQVAKQLPKNTDYVLIIDQLKLSNETKKSLVVFSNQLVNRTFENKFGINSLKLVDYKRLKVVAEVANLRWDESESAAEEKGFKINIPASAAPAAKILAQNYSYALSKLFVALAP